MEKYAGMNNGEVRLYELLETLEDEAHKVHANFVVDRHKEGTNQIDAMLICKKGVFVFEMKDYNGWIFGNEDNKEWTQVLNKGKLGSKKVRFRNPVKQNENHIKTIKHLLNQAGIYVPIINVVVFGEGASLKDVTASVDVVNLNRVLEVIEKYPDMSVDQLLIDKIHTVVTEKASYGEAAIAEHISYVEGLSAKANSGNVDTERELRKDSTGKSFKKGEDVSIGTLLKISFILIGIFLLLAGAIKYSYVLLLGLFLLIPRKSRRRHSRKRQTNGWFELLLLMLFLGAFFGSYVVSELRNKTIYDRSVNREVSTMETVKTRPVNSMVNTEPPTVEYVEEGIIITESEVEGVKATEPITEQANVTITETTTEATTEVTTDFVAEEKVDIAKTSFVLALGATKSQVLEALGEPTKSNGLTDYYKNSAVNYDGDGNVSGWKNLYGTLDQVMSKAKGGKLRLGIRFDEVVAALGTPSTIEYLYPFRWYYGNAVVTFDSEWNVNGWNNTYGELNQAIIVPTGGKLSLGVGAKDVIFALGSPSEISFTNPYRWYYRNAYVTFDSDWNVNGWRNTYGELNQALIVPIGGKLSLGMTTEDVVAALGTPSEISYTDKFTWYYKNSRVTFNSDWNVTGWKNTYGELDSALVVPSGGKIAIGINKDALLEALGTPSEIAHNNPYRWYYKNSYVTFDAGWIVNGWRDLYGELKPSFYNPQGGTLDVGSTSEDVIRVLGTPTEISSSNPFIWTYKNSTVLFGSDWKIQKWKNLYGQFDGVFPGE